MSKVKTKTKTKRAAAKKRAKSPAEVWDAAVLAEMERTQPAYDAVRSSEKPRTALHRAHAVVTSTERSKKVAKFQADYEVRELEREAAANAAQAVANENDRVANAAIVEALSDVAAVDAAILRLVMKTAWATPSEDRADVYPQLATLCAKKKQIGYRVELKRSHGRT